MICSDISPIQGVYSSGHAAIVCVPGFVTCVCTYVHTAQLTFFACLCRIHCSVLLQPLEYSTTEANGSCFSCQTQPSHLHVRIHVYIDIRKRHLICARQSYWMPLAVTIATNQEKMPAKKQAQLQVSLTSPLLWMEFSAVQYLSGVYMCRLKCPQTKNGIIWYLQRH